MERSFYKDFSSVSKKEWIQKIENDLKGRSIEELSRTITEDWKISPFYAREDIAQPTQINKYYPSCLISQDFDATDDSLADKLMEGLENGVDAPRITNIVSTGKLFQKLPEVRWEMIKPVFQLEDKADLSSLGKHLKEDQDFYLQSSSEIEKLPHFPNAKYRCFVLPSAAHKDLPAQLSSFFTDLLKILDNAPEKDLESIVKSCWVIMEQGPDFYMQIAKLRAIRLLWRFFLSHYPINEELALPVMATVGSGVDQEDPYKNMIAYSAAAMYSMVGGADLLNVKTIGDPSSNLSESFQRRIARNIQHIPKLESYIDKVQDPVAGSYAFESITQKLCSLSWEMFIDKKGSSGG